MSEKKDTTGKKERGTVPPPARQLDRQLLQERAYFDLSDYRFVVSVGLAQTFDIVPARLDDEEGFLLFYPLDDITKGQFALFNFHCFLKRTGSVEDFVRSLGQSVADIPLEKTEVFGVPAWTYVRRIKMADLFAGAHHIIDFIGGEPDLEVRDSHTYFSYQHFHYYTGMLHADNNEHKYDTLRERLLKGIRLV